MTVSKLKSEPGQNPKRKHTIDRKENGNIIRQFKLYDYKRLDEDEFVGLQNYINSFDSKLSPFVHVDINVEPPNSDKTIRQINCFNLVIMNKEQRAMLFKYGNKAISVDATHHTTPYSNIKLITMMVLDQNEYVYYLVNSFSY